MIDYNAGSLMMIEELKSIKDSVKKLMTESKEKAIIDMKKVPLKYKKEVETLIGKVIYGEKNNYFYSYISRNSNIKKYKLVSSVYHKNFSLMLYLKEINKDGIKTQGYWDSFTNIFSKEVKIFTLKEAQDRIALGEL